METQMKRTQRQAFIAYIKNVKPLEEVWTGWKRELLLNAQNETILESHEPDEPNWIKEGF